MGYLSAGISLILSAGVFGAAHALNTGVTGPGTIILGLAAGLVLVSGYLLYGFIRYFDQELWINRAMYADQLADYWQAHPN